MTGRTRSRRIGWRAVRWAAGGLVLLLVAAVVVVTALSQTRVGRSWVRRTLEDVLARSVVGRVHVGAVEGNLLGRVALRGVRIYDADGVRAVAIARLEARYEVWPVLLGRPLRVRTLAVAGLALHLVERHGRWNVAELVAPADDGAGAPALTIDDLRLRAASVKVRGARAGIGVRGLALDATIASASDATRADVARLTFEIVDRDIAVEEIAGHVRVTADGAAATAGRARTRRSALRWDGTVSAGDSGVYDVLVAVDRLAAADIRALAGRGTPAADGVGRLRIHGPAARLRMHAKLATRAGDASLRAGLDDGADGTAARYDATGRVWRVDLAGLGIGDRPTALGGTLRVDGQGLTTALAHAAATVRLDAGSSVGDLVVDEALLEGEATPARLTVAVRAAAARGEARLEAALDRAAGAYDVTVDVRALDLGRLLDRPALAGAVTATAQGSGRGLSAADHEGRFEVVLAPSTIGAARIAAGTARVRAAPGIVTIERFALDADAVQVESTGTLALPDAVTDGAAGELQLTAAADDLRTLAALAGRDDVGGALRHEATITGSADALGGVAHLQGRGLRAGGIDLGRLDASATAEGFDPTAGGARAPARVTLAGTLQGLTVAGRTVEALRLTSSYERAGRGRDGTARVAIEATEADARAHELAATLTTTAGVTRIDVDALRLQPGAVPWTLAGTPVITLRGGGVAIEALALTSAEGGLRASGHVDPGGTNDLTVTLDGLPLAAVGSLVAVDLAGTLAGTLRLEGSGAAPDVTLDAAIADPAVAGVAYDELRARVTVRAGQGEAELRVTEGGVRRVSIEAAAPIELALAPFVLRSGPGLRGRLEARGLAVAALGPLVPALEDLGGMLEADLTLAGSPTAPELRGALRLVDGRVRVPALGVTYDPVDVAVRVDGARAVVERFDARSGEGHLRGEGEAVLAAGVPKVNLRFELTRFPLVGSEQGHGAASGWLWLTGTPADPVIGGTLQTEGLTLRLPEEATTRIAESDPTITVVRGPRARPDVLGLDPSPPDRAPALAAPSLYDRAAITIQIDVPRNAWLKRSDAEIELRGWATVWKKPDAALAVAAEIAAVRGWYAFRGKRFTLVEGKVTLSGNDLDPLLELVAMYRARDYKVFVVVGGTLSDPTLRLESEPALDQADVLSVLLFGRTSAELSGGETQALQEQTVAIASSYAAQGLSQSVAGSLGLDSLQVDAVGTGGVDETQVTAGKYLADDVFVALSHRFGKETVDELRIEYQFLPEWSLETSSDTLGQSGVDVFWKRRY